MTDMVAAATKFITIAQLGAALTGAVSFYQAQATNSFSCALKFSGDNLWHYIASWYYLADTFG